MHSHHAHRLVEQRPSKYLSFTDFCVKSQVLCPPVAVRRKHISTISNQYSRGFDDPMRYACPKSRQLVDGFGGELTSKSFIHNPLILAYIQNLGKSDRSLSRL